MSPYSQHQATAPATAANRALFTKKLVGYLRTLDYVDDGVIRPESPQIRNARARSSSLAKSRLLRQRAFEVSQGYAKLWAQQDCERYTFPIMRTCYGHNPGNPYVVPIVKSWKDEFVDPAMVNALGKTRRGYSATHRLDPREAIIVFGKMPSPARCMGLQTWVWTKRWLTDDQPWDPAVRV